MKLKALTQLGTVK